MSLEDRRLTTQRIEFSVDSFKLLMYRDNGEIWLSLSERNPDGNGVGVRITRDDAVRLADVLRWVAER